MATNALAHSASYSFGFPVQTATMPHSGSMQHLCGGQPNDCIFLTNDHVFLPASTSPNKGEIIVTTDKVIITSSPAPGSTANLRAQYSNFAPASPTANHNFPHNYSATNHHNNAVVATPHSPTNHHHNHNTAPHSPTNHHYHHNNAFVAAPAAPQSPTNHHHNHNNAAVAAAGAGAGAAAFGAIGKGIDVSEAFYGAGELVAGESARCAADAVGEVFGGFLDLPVPGMGGGSKHKGKVEAVRTGAKAAKFAAKLAGVPGFG